MTKRRDGLRPGEVARALRVAKKIADAVGVDPSSGFIGSGRLIALRNVVARLRIQQLRPRDLDTPNGTDAIAAIASTMTLHELLVEPQPMPKVWELIVSRAMQYLTAEMRRRHPYRESLPPPLGTTRRPGIKVWG